ncbi:MAG TPA: PHP domain-containing protein [Thermoanaerobaculia bacterium]|nr:PHP domain-containing protein [Thermoanaerobaculia bacterium]
MDRKRFAQMLSEMADMLELSGANQFKVRAYENGARAIMEFPGELADSVASGALRKVPGVGDTIFSHAGELVRTGRIAYYDELRALYPPTLTDCLRIPGLGSRKLRTLHHELGIDSLEALQLACLDGRVAALKGFGPKSRDHILRGIAMVRAAAGRFLYPAAVARAERLVESLAATGLASAVAAAGGVRRRSEVVDGLSLVAATERPVDLALAFSTLPEVVDVLESAPPAPGVRFLDGLPATLAIVAPEELPAALLHATGSAEHLEGLRARAVRRGMRLEPLALVGANGRPIPLADEDALYAALGLPPIPPVLREGLGEIEAAESGALPRLVRREDLRGLIHVHTDASDGRESLETMVTATRDLGYSWVAITDHSRTAGYAGGLTEERVREQREAIRALRRRFDGFRIFHGTEADILKDGSIDFGDEFLGELDLVVASVHSRFGLSREEQTERLIRAVRNPRVAVLGHPTGRLLLARPGLDADMEAVIDAAAESGCAIEVNGSPRRLDLDWRLVRRAVAKGVLISIDPDAHATRELRYAEWGAGIAAKGWTTPDGVLNAMDADGLAAWLEARRGGPIPESRDREG